MTKVFSARSNPLRPAIDAARSSRSGAWGLVTSLLLVAVLAVVFAQNSSWRKRFEGHVIHAPGVASVSARTGERVQVHAAIKSLSDRTVKVVGAQLPCGCIAVSPMPLEIPPNDICDLIVTIDTSGRSIGKHEFKIPLLVDTASPLVAVDVVLSVLGPGSADDEIK